MPPPPPVKVEVKPEPTDFQMAITDHAIAASFLDVPQEEIMAENNLNLDYKIGLARALGLILDDQEAARLPHKALWGAQVIKEKWGLTLHAHHPLSPGSLTETARLPF